MPGRLPDAREREQLAAHYCSAIVQGITQVTGEHFDVTQALSLADQLREDLLTALEHLRLPEEAQA